MNILYINHYAGTLNLGMEFRPFYMAKQWKKAGHNVLIVASSESHVRAKNPVLQSAFKKESIDDVDYLWCKTSKYKGNGLDRVINIFSFLFRLLQKSPYFIKQYKPDVVIASSTYPLDIFPAFLIARLSGAKLTYEVHDLWPLSPIELGGMSKFHPFIMLLQFAENFAYRVSDSIVSMLPLAKDHMIEHGMAESKFNYVPNGIDFSEWDNITGELPPELAHHLQEDLKNNRFSVAYLGAHGVANALENLLNATELLKDHPVTVYLIGDGPEKNKLKAFAEGKKLRNVIFINPVPKNLIPKVTEQFDVLYIGLQAQSLFRFGISPNKMMDYMAAGRPIINAIKAGNDPVAEAACGISVPPETPNAVANAILKMMSMSEQELHEMGLKGQKYVRSHHSYSVLGRRFLEAMRP